MPDAADKNPGLVDKSKKREILELKVNELSVVDRPAILRDFLVVKRRQQEEPMGAFKDESQSADVEKALPADLKTAITSVVAWMKKNKSAEGAPGDDIDRVVAFLGEVSEGKYPYPNPASMKKADEPAADEKKDKEKDKAKGGATDDDEENKDKNKSESGNADALSIKISPTGEVTVSGNAVAKGASQFSTDRKGNLKDAVNKLFGMLAEVDKEAARGLVDELLKAQLPGEVKWQQASVPSDASVTKQLETALSPVVQQIEALVTKVDQIEKARPAPKSAAGDSTTETTVSKGASVWAGLPLG